MWDTRLQKFAAVPLCIDACRRIADLPVLYRNSQVQGLPGALPAQLVRPTSGTVTWLLDADSAAGIAPEKWSDDPKAYPRRCAVCSWYRWCLKPTLRARLSLSIVHVPTSLDSQRCPIASLAARPSVLCCPTMMRRRRCCAEPGCVSAQQSHGQEAQWIERRG